MTLETFIHRNDIHIFKACILSDFNVYYCVFFHIFPETEYRHLVIQST